jgi:protein involved in polysaccharide export with SLBB domain
MKSTLILTQSLLCISLFAITAQCDETLSNPTSTGITAATAVEASVSDNYRLAANDLINVKVFQEDDLSTNARISADGKIPFPLIGQVQIAGKTTHDAAQIIAHLLDARYLVNPQVSITVMSYARRGFTVLGEVLKAGSYNMQFQDSIDLLEAIGTAGGYTRLANPGKITVKRRDHERDVIFEVNGKDLASGHSGKSFRIKPGDMITVGQRMF